MVKSAFVLVKAHHRLLTFDVGGTKGMQELYYTSSRRYALACIMGGPEGNLSVFKVTMTESSSTGMFLLRSLHSVFP